MWESIKVDIKNNRRAGLLTVLFLINYRLGRFFMIKKNQLFIFWLPYFPCLIIARLLSVLFGCSVPFSAHIGDSVTFKHGLYGVFISGLAVIGDGCVIFHHVTIGSNYGSRRKIGAPVIGDSVLVGAGAKIIGPLNIEDRSIVPAGSVVFSNVVCRKR